MKGRHLTIVIKLGTSSIVDEKTHQPLLSTLSLIVETAVRLHKDGHKVVIVSSGAIGIGLRRMDIERRPKNLPKIQALAAVGQCRLMSLWDSLFGHLRQPVAQILLTRNDIADRTQYLNAKNTLDELLQMGVIPIVNENDTVAVAEIKFGDNDTLSAITAAMVQADYLFLMTDVDCLYDKNPRTNPDAKAIEVVEDITTLEVDVSTAGSGLGTGSMSTKIVAARLATSAGVTTVITRSSNPRSIADIVKYLQAKKVSQPATPATPSSETASKAGEDILSRSLSSLHLEGHPKPPLHTYFIPDPKPLRDRYIWILHGLTPRGIVYIDEGAYRALAAKAGLLPAGIVGVGGTFAQQEAIRLVVVKRSPPTDSATSALERTEILPMEVGRAIVNYNSAEIAKIQGIQSTEIQHVLGYADSEYVALRENIAFLKKERGSRPATPSLATPAESVVMEENA